MHYGDSRTTTVVRDNHRFIVSGDRSYFLSDVGFGSSINSGR